MERTCTNVWVNCLQIIKDNIPAQSFKTWFEPIKALRLEGNVLTIQVPSLFFYEWLEEHYVGLLRKTVKKQLGEEGRLEYNIVVEKSSNSIPFTTNMPSNGNGAEGKNQSMPMPVSLNKDIKNPFVIPGLKKLQVDPQLNQNYTFENFIEGDCNRLARSASSRARYQFNAARALSRSGSSRATAFSGSSQMLNSADGVEFPWSWAPPIITISGIRSRIRGSFWIAVAMLVSGPTGTSVIWCGTSQA